MRHDHLALNILAISRAYSIPYLSIAGLAALLLCGAPMTPTVLGGLIAIPACLTVGLAALNDALHATADARAGRGRDYPLALLWLLGVGGTASALLVALRSGLWVIGGIAATVVSGLIYAKLKHRPGLGNLVRGLTTVSLIFGLGGLAGAGWSIWPLAFGLGLLDAAGNIWGDVRDVVPDRRAHVITLVVLQPRLAIVVAVVLHALAAGLLAIAASWWVSLSLVGSVYVLASPPYWQHRAFLMVKYITVIGVALLAASTTYELALVAIFMPSAALAWMIYTRIHRPTEEPAHATTD